MDESKAIEYLMHFGMSRQEATVYLRLIEAGKQTGLLFMGTLSSFPF